MAEESAPVTTLVESLLDIEEIDENIFRATRLWRPGFARGVFGGHILSMSLLACTRTVEAEKAVHSLHSYFLLPGDDTIPIIFVVKRLRDGKSFATRTCDAIQRGRVIFSCMASFHRQDEQSTASFQTSMPVVPPAESLPTQQQRVERMLQDPRLPEALKPVLKKQFSRVGPIDSRYCTETDPLEPGVQPPERSVWWKTRGEIHADAHLMMHQCVAAYASDFDLIMTALLPTGRGRTDVSMMASLDHSMWFHTPFRADDWMLYHMQCLRLENNRGLCQGKIYTRDGRLAVSVCQEGVVRLSPKPFSFSAMLEEHRAKGDKGGAVSVEALAEAAAKGAPRSML